MNIKVLLSIALSFLTTTVIAGNNYQCTSEGAFGFQTQDNKIEPVNFDSIKFIITKVSSDESDFAACRDKIVLKSKEIIAERVRNEKIRNGIIITSQKVDIDTAISKKTLCYGIDMDPHSRVEDFFKHDVCVHSESMGIKNLDCPNHAVFNFSMSDELYFYISVNSAEEKLKYYFKNRKNGVATLFNAYGKCSKV